MEQKRTKNYGVLAFIPLIVFLLIYLGSGIIFTLMGVPDSFKQVPREFALVGGIVAVLFMGKDRTFDEKIDILAKSGGESGVILMSLIFLLAGAFSGVAKGMGGVDATVNLGLTFIPKQFIFAGVFIISSVIATAMGTSMGTISAIGPIALGVAEKAAVSPAIAIAAVIGGAMFGDNLSIISDTTIAATKGAGCEMRDKFKMNLLIALPAAIISIIVYCFVGAGGELTGEYPFEIIKVLPYVVVLITAIMGLNVVAVLMLVIAMCGVIGMFTGAFDFPGFAQAAAGGINGMASIIILAIMLRGITGVVKEYGGIDWLLDKLGSRVKTRRGAEYAIAALVGIIDVSMANNTIAILVSCPLAMTLAKKFNIAPKRIASLLDIFACSVQGIIPHGGQLLLAMGLTGLSPFAIIGKSYYLFLLAIAAIITIHFGLLKTTEEKEGKSMYKYIQNTNSNALN